jgi:hypothetical protein
LLSNLFPLFDEGMSLFGNPSRGMEIMPDVDLWITNPLLRRIKSRISPAMGYDGYTHNECLW